MMPWRRIHAVFPLAPFAAFQMMPVVSATVCESRSSDLAAHHHRQGGEVDFATGPELGVTVMPTLRKASVGQLPA